MSDRITTLAQWRRAFRRIDRCPWPGPRPMTRDDEALLIGRGDDADRFSSDVQRHPLVVLTGESGVGKSSLLNAGLVRELSDNGYFPLLCSDWTRADKGIEDPEAFVADKVWGQLPPEIDIDGHGATGLCCQLDSTFGDRAVLVLDQFEELIRYQPDLFTRMIDWILSVNHRHEMRIVLSLRSEYAHKLKRLNSSVMPFSMARYDLESLTDEETAEEVIKSGNRSGMTVITDDATAGLLDAWRAAVGDDGGHSGGLGLLHLQATLYALHDQASGAVVQHEHVLRMIDDADDVFTAGLRAAVGVKLGRCVAACSAEELSRPLDDALITGTSGVVRRLVGHLSSGGYKLVSEEWDLAQKGLGRELGVLGQPAEAETLFRALARLAVDRTSVQHQLEADDLLSATRHSIDITAGLSGVSNVSAPSYLAKLGVDPVPWHSDPDDVSSGPMLGMPPRSILIEELRRFVFAMVWLREASLVRTSSPAPGQTMASLIHDGFGPALERWAAKRRTTPAEALNLLTAARGEAFYWSPGAGESAHVEFNGGDGFVTIANVRWQYCLISAMFQRVVFVNCDFRGSRFERCGFRGVVFVNCLLDGVAFGNCSITGGVSAPTEVWSEDLPSFMVTVPGDAIQALDRYRETATGGNQLYSVTSGVPAVPWSGAPPDVLAWEPQTGGLTMYGGRLNSLWIRDCAFSDDGILAFRHIAGSSLDLVEQSGGRVEVFGSAIRGLSVTRPVDAEQIGAPLTLKVNGSKLVNTWFGDRLSGSARFENSVLWQLMNLSERGSPGSGRVFEVRVHNNCRFYGLVNVDTPTDSIEMTNISMDGLNEPEEIVSGAIQMDYRKVPARLELEKRMRRQE